MADDFGEFKGLMDAADKEHTSFQTLAKKTLGEIKAAQTALKALGTGVPNVKNRGWLKRAEKAGADKKLLDALKKVETAGTRASCVDAAKLTKADKSNKEVAAIGAEIDKLLDKDESLAKGLEKQQAVIKQLTGQADKLKSGGDKLDQAAMALAKEAMGLVKELKANPDKAG